MKVALITDFRDWSPAYSLTHVVIEQSRMLQEHGIPHRVFTPQLCDDRAMPPDIAEHVDRSLASIANTYYNQNEAAAEDFNPRAKQLCESYVTRLDGFDVLVAHDLLTSAWHLEHRKALEGVRARVKIAWCHSMPQNPTTDCRFPSILRFTAAPGWQYVFPNMLAATLGREAIAHAQTHVVYNSRDIRSFFGFTQTTCDLIERWHLFDHDFMQVFPFSLPRWRSKGVPVLLKFFSKLKLGGKKVKLILVDAHANSDWAQEEIRKLKSLAKHWGLVFGEDYYLTSDDRAGWMLEVPHEVVRDLMILSNIFVFPSETEGCSLIQGEAMISGKVVVLNNSFAPLLEFVPSWCYQFAFSDHNPETDDWFYDRAARNIAEACARDSTFIGTTAAKTRFFNREWIWRNQFSPLLEVSDGNVA